MHVKETIINRIVIMLMCILLLSNFGLSIVLATEQNIRPKGAGITVSNDGQTSINYKAHNTTVVFSDLPEAGGMAYSGRPLIQKITVSESGAYTINLATKNGPARYTMYTSDKKFVRLAAEYKGGSHHILTGGPSNTSSEIDVFLEKGKEYYIMMAGTSQPITIEGKTGGYPVTLSIIKRTDLLKNGVYATNISASVVSEGGANPNSSSLEQYNAESIKIYELSEKEINNYVLYGNEEEMANGGTLQGILVDIIIVIGTVFTAVVEEIIGANTQLTIDSVIFNKLDQTVVDLTPLGGIQVGGTGQGIFYQSEIGQVIKILYDSLKNLAIAVYIVMFLYIGVKVLLSVGGPNQSKYFKYIEYWITGLIILAIVPYFLPAIPSMTNAVVEMMADKAKQINGNYSTKEILQRLNYNGEYLGEDKEIVEIERLIEERINELNGLMTGDATSIEEAQSQIDSKIDDALSRFSDLTSDEKNAVKSKIENITNLIDENFDSWDDPKQAQYEEYIQDVREQILSNSSVADLVDEIRNDLPNEIKNDTVINSEITRIMKIVQRNASVWNSVAVSEYQKNIDYLVELLEDKGLEEYEDNCIHSIESAKTEYLQYANTLAFRELEKLFEDYKNSVIQQEITELQELKTGLARDVMTMLKKNAQKENRLVYAIAWAILLFQMFKVLFLYYKRLFAIIIIIIIFPLIMAFYVIDKIGDGKSQSLKQWFNELLANCLVQVLHAAIYIIIINIGIDACEADPTKNWFILVLTVCFLFPGERIIRSIVGLKASTLGELKNNFGGVLMGAHAVTTLTKNGYRLGKAYVKDGGVKGIKEKWNKELEKSKKEQEDKKSNKQKLQASRERSRKYREQRIADKDASLFDKVVNKVDKAKDVINATAIVSGTRDIASKVKSSNIVKSGIKIAKATSRYGKFALRKTGSLARKGVGLTMGAMEGMENFAHEGTLSALGTARRTAHSIGGFKNQQPTKKDVKTAELTDKELKIKEQASNFTTKYENGKKVSGTKNITPGNTADGTNNNNKMANKIKSKINININPPSN